MTETTSLSDVDQFLLSMLFEEDGLEAPIDHPGFMNLVDLGYVIGLSGDLFSEHPTKAVFFLTEGGDLMRPEIIVEKTVAWAMFSFLLA